jgi:hypothetical protein
MVQHHFDTFDRRHARHGSHTCPEQIEFHVRHIAVRPAQNLGHSEPVLPTGCRSGCTALRPVLGIPTQSRCPPVVQTLAKRSWRLLPGQYTASDLILPTLTRSLGWTHETQIEAANHYPRPLVCQRLAHIPQPLFGSTPT